MAQLLCSLISQKSKTTLSLQPLPVSIFFFSVFRYLNIIQGYKPGTAKTAEEYANLDAEDESLARWKASLGIVPGDKPSVPSGVKVTFCVPSHYPPFL